MKRAIAGAALCLFGFSIPPSIASPVFQCPEGTPPPCAHTSARGTSSPVDPHRIAILPFRVTGADSSLGEGIAELLAAEFTGESGPRAVHMGNVIKAFRQAGGGAHQPLTQPVAARAARQLGAGYYVDGSIVGLGSSLTVTASVVSVADGRSRRAAPISGSNDSITVLLGRLTTTMLALSGGESREGSRGVLTASPAAMRDYLEGMAQWRRFRTADASAAFERAFNQDTLFARAAFMRHWIASWFNQPVAPRWAQTAWSLRERLSAADRALLTAQLGNAFPARRSSQQSIADRVRAAALLPESPEAQYLAGDLLFHNGSGDAADALERARGYFERSWDLDSQTTILSHLVAVGVILSDTPLVRSLQPAVTVMLPHSSTAWYVAGFLRDSAMLAQLRSQTMDSIVPAGWDQIGRLPAAVSDAMFTRMRRGPRFALIRMAVPAMQGRPGAIRASLAQAPPATLDEAALVIWLVMNRDLDSASGADAVRRLERMPGLSADTAAERDCDVALWSAWWGSGTAWPDSLTTARENLNCPAMVNLLRSWRAHAPDLAVRLATADSLVRWRMMNFGTFRGYENLVLARVWESQGNIPRAFSALRLRIDGLFGTPGRGHVLIDEGRLALLASDTVSALRAFRMYLGYRTDAEPELFAERDSVRAELLRLEKR